MKSYVKNFKSNSNITKVSYRRISNGIDNNMNIAIIGSPKYDSVRAVRDFLFNIKLLRQTIPPNSEIASI